MTYDPTASALNRESIAAADLLRGLAADQVDLDEEELQDVIEGETSLLEAIAAAIDEIDRCEIIAAGCKVKVEQIEKRATRAGLRAQRVRAMIEATMAMVELTTAKLPLATVTLKTMPPRPVITDESLIPAEFWKPQPPMLDKAALAKAAKDGDVPGVTMANGPVSLQIRRT